MAVAEHADRGMAVPALISLCCSTFGEDVTLLCGALLKHACEYGQGRLYQQGHQ